MHRLPREVLIAAAEVAYAEWERKTADTTVINTPYSWAASMRTGWDPATVDPSEYELAEDDVEVAFEGEDDADDQT